MSQQALTIQRLPDRRTDAAKLLTPLLLHMELDFRTFLKVQNGLKEGLFQLRKLPGLHRLQTPRKELKALRGELGVLHLLGETRLLGFEHAAEKLVELDPVRNGQIALLKLDNQLVAQGHFFVGPATRAAIGEIDRGGIPSDRSIAAPALASAVAFALGRERRGGSLRLIDFAEGQGKEDETVCWFVTLGTELQGTITVQRSASLATKG